MKPFLIDPITPATQPTPTTTTGRVLAVLETGQWYASREIETLSGVDRLEVDTVIQNLLRRGTVGTGASVSAGAHGGDHSAVQAGGAMSHNTYLDAVAEAFRARPGEEINNWELAGIGGANGWRTRVSECRLLLGMDIPQPRKELNPKTGVITTWYRYRPAVVPVQAGLWEQEGAR